MENWKDIQGYEGLYQISDLGRVKSLQRMKKMSRGKDISVKERIRKAFEWEGYWGVRLCKDGKMRNKKIHRLVAIAFIPNPENKKEVNHLNGKGDNTPGSLEWSTHLENCQHALKNGFYTTTARNQGETNGMSKLTDQIVREIRENKLSKKRSELAKIYNVSHALISLVITNKIWKHAC